MFHEDLDVDANKNCLLLCYQTFIHFIGTSSFHRKDDSVRFYLWSIGIDSQENGLKMPNLEWREKYEKIKDLKR